MEASERNQMFSVLKKYYEQGMNQEQIAKEEFISKSSVCRLIKKAVAGGYVRFRINYPCESNQALEQELMQRFTLKTAFVTPAFTNDEDNRLKDTCRAAAEDLQQLLGPDDILGVTCGDAINRFADILESETVSKTQCAKVALMNGCTTGDAEMFQSDRIAGVLSGFFDAQGYILPVPLLVDTEETAQALRQDSHVRGVLDVGRQANIALVSIGAINNASSTLKRRMYPVEDLKLALKNGAAGMIAGRCYNSQGKPVQLEINKRVLGLELSDIKQKKHRIGIAVGEHKAQAVLGALRGKLVNHLYTDEITAQRVLDLASAK